jgi:hypothetical protein
MDLPDAEKKTKKTSPQSHARQMDEEPEKRITRDQGILSSTTKIKV